jgi:NADPH:quinone reductase-like Zn-dependent oxidoreductase
VTAFEVRRDDLRQTRLVDAAAPDPADGEAVLRVRSVGLTANNVTYAVFGEAMSYWDFFPAEQGWGRVPMWGFAEVERSNAEGVEPGTRVYGYLPPASELLVTPASASKTGFVDASPHRAELPSAYHRYVATGPDPFHRPDTEAIQMLLRPLFFTSFLIDDQLADEGLVERGPVLLSSASSKTAIAAAHMLSRRQGSELVGLTSPANATFVESLGVYDSVVAYDDIGSLSPGPATFVDVAGDAAVRRSVHEAFGDELVHSMAVGVTHWESGVDLTRGEDLPGPPPVFFFAPTRVSKRSRDWGPAGLEARVAEAWHPFCEWTTGWLEVVPGSGFEALRDGFLELLDGGPGPDRARVISFD